MSMSCACGVTRSTPWHHTEGSRRGAKMPSQTMPVSLQRELIFPHIFEGSARVFPGKPVVGN